MCACAARCAKRGRGWRLGEKAQEFRAMFHGWLAGCLLLCSRFHLAIHPGSFHPP